MPSAQPYACIIFDFDGTLVVPSQAQTAQPGAHAIVTDVLSAGLLVGVLTSMNRSTVTSCLNRLEFPIKQFLFIQGGNDTIHYKPNPDVFDPVLSQLIPLGIAPHQALYIGDTPADFYAANGAGLDFIGVTN